jgi:2-oxoglutarate ferredoxin oxidoreductase subunit alpha
LLTDTGVSPRALPGHPNAVFTVTSDEHTEEGYMEDEDPVNRVQQMEKRMRKLELAAAELRLPSWYGPADAKVTLMSWGSTVGAVREAVDMLNAEGVSVNSLHFFDIYPLPEDALTAEINKARRLIAVECNYTGQLAKYVRMCTGRKPDALIAKYDGRAFSTDEIVARVKSEVLVHA